MRVVVTTDRKFAHFDNEPIYCEGVTLAVVEVVAENTVVQELWIMDFASLAELEKFAVKNGPITLREPVDVGLFDPQQQKYLLAMQIPDRRQHSLDLEGGYAID